MLPIYNQEGGVNAQFEAMAAEIKSAKWPVPFTAMLSEPEGERSYQFTATDKAAYPVTFFLVYKKKENLIYPKVQPS